VFGSLDILTLSVLPSLVGAVAHEEEEYVTELRNLPEGWLAAGALALLMATGWAVLWMYRNEGRLGASLRVRLGLTVIRFSVFVILAVVLLEPVRVRILRRWIESYAVVLVDDSSSMDLTDRYRDAPTALRVTNVLGAPESEPIRRTDVAARVLTREDRAFLRDLAERNRVRLYSYSDEPRLRATIRARRERPTTGKAARSAQSDGDTPSSDDVSRIAHSEALLSVEDAAIEVTARGPATNIERAVRQSVESLGSAPVAAVVVLSDGGFNQGASSQDTARYARERGFPIHTVGIGDPTSPRNVRVTEILAPPNAFQQDPFAVSAQLAAEGLDGRSLLVQLRERSASDGGTGSVVDSRSVRVEPGGTVPPVTFQRSQSRIGRFIYTIDVPPLEAESVADDNSRQTTVNVIDSRTRVLLIASGPSWEYRFVSRLLTRDDTFDLSCWLQSADYSAVRDGNTVIDHLPITAEELFEYDVIVLLDPDPAELSDTWCRLLDTFVTEHGGGILLEAARPHTPVLMRDRALKPLHDLLPVTLDPEADLVLNEVGHYQRSGSPLAIPPTAFGHPVMKLADDTVSTKLIWQGIGDIYWHYPVVREKPVATVLMRHGNPRMRNSYGGHVLAAVQFVGRGRTGFLAFDGTWRWRRHGVGLFDRFWVQLVRYLAEGKLLGGTKRGTLLTDADQYSLGEAVTVTARLFDAQYEPLRRDQVIARYGVDGDRGDVTLTAHRDQPGWFEGRFVPDRTGSYRITLNMMEPRSGNPTEIAREIRVERPNIEILRPQMDRAALVTLAGQSHGGQYFEVDEAAELPDLIPDLHEEIPIRSRPRTLWDNWVTLVILATLLSVEWGARKWNRLL